MASDPDPVAETCAACGGAELRPHLRVARARGDAGLIPTTDQFGTALGDIVRCAECGHMQLDPLPAERDLDTTYGDAASEDYVEEEAGQRETARRALARIERHAAPGALLDVGAWVGYLVAEAGDRGWTATGVEPSTFASTFARDRLGADVRTGGLFDTELPERRFAAVTMGDVIEHFVRPEAALDRIAGLLAPDGVLWLALPDAGSRVARAIGRRWWSVIPTHVQYFTRASIGTCCAAAAMRCWRSPPRRRPSPCATTSIASAGTPGPSRPRWSARRGRSAWPTGCGPPTSATG
jgi:SAM-dependent methyltransferase